MKQVFKTGNKKIEVFEGEKDSQVPKNTGPKGKGLFEASPEIDPRGAPPNNQSTNFQSTIPRIANPA
ncbi:MAG: hypothetical protein R2773_00810 [Flavobacteriaceae bacterium]